MPKIKSMWNPMVNIRAQRSQSGWDPIGGEGGTKCSKNKTDQNR